jgi:hypothetical protein
MTEEQRNEVLEEAAKFIEERSSYSGFSDVGLIHARWLRELKTYSQMTIQEVYGEITVK